MTSAEDMKKLLTEVFKTAVEGAHPRYLFHGVEAIVAMKETLDQTPGRTLVLGAGKASSAMAAALEEHWKQYDHPPLEGLVVTREGYETQTDSIEIVTAGHPYPDEKSVEIAERMLNKARQMGEGDLLIGLWSGGGSALLACPPQGISFASFLTLTKDLLGSGADIDEINCVRKHLSQIAGGRLAQAAAPATLLDFIISDVAAREDADEIRSAVASGPLAPDPTTQKDALKILNAYKINADPAILTHLQDPANETPGSYEDIGAGDFDSLLATAEPILEIAEDALKEKGYQIVEIAMREYGEAREVAREHAKIIKRLANPAKPVAIVSGGELTVTLNGDGTGGPNQEYALALAMELEGMANVAVFSGDTDGTDGIGGAAGAFVFPDTLERMRDAGIDPQAALANNDAGSAFAAIGDLLICGPTFTNVNDLRLIVING